MSLIRIALRMTAVMALKGRTLASDNVLDSEIGVFREKDQGFYLKKKDRFIAVYTDAANAQADEARNLLENGLVSLSIEYGVTDAMVLEEPDPEDPDKMIESVIPGIPYTSRMPEFYLDILGRQIRSCLQGSTSEPADVFRGLFSRVTKQSVERADSDNNGERVAAQKLTFTLDALRDPVFATDVIEGLPFARFLALLDAGTPDDQALAGLIRSEIPAAPETDEEIQARIGSTAAEMQALGFGLFEDADASSIANLVTIQTPDAEPVEVS
ncbi:hypothetical protein J7444_08140 [Labrenzia sp. R4_1]|uniref:hypothetical protein n=1 Tax=Labrenzia sp. R4_1 TaxID=2821106 RepID=UPI001ADA6EB5|nr:hypothetical protein [Labrenzia sp. R4_1]MBO9424687.1 hypothetical protein [Labrenzia sp. R4_1]